MPSTPETIITTLNQRIADNSLHLPLLPDVANRVLQLTQDPDSTSAQLATLLQSDPALAGHAMRIANSAAYCPNTELVSLQQAITRLGMKMLAEIALTATMGAKMFKAPGYEQHLAGIWRHALATALWGKEIACISRRNVDSTFLCGLLHSIGKPVVLQAVLEIAAEQQQDLGLDEVLQIEADYQRTVGLAVCREWQMPKLVQETIEFLDNPNDAPNAEQQIVMVVGGRAFAEYMLDPERVSEEQLRTLDIIETLNLYDDEIDQLLEQLPHVQNTLEAMTR